MKQPLDIAALHAKHAVLLSAYQQDGDTAALRAILDDYKPMFGKAIRELMRGQTLSADHQADLHQECMLAAIKAIDGFDLAKGTKLTTYLLMHVRGALKRYVLDNKAPCRLGTSSDDRKAYYAAQRIHATRSMEGSAVSERDVQTIANDSATSLKTARRALTALQASPCDLDSVQDMMAEPDPTDSFLDRNATAIGMAAFEELVVLLPERTRDILVESFLSHHCDHVIHRLAEKHQITVRRVRQLQKEGLASLKTMMENQGLMADALF
jgi:RNA polymerase sigma factor (sigma-70 family)